MAIRLLINGMQADLGASQSITLRQLSDFFNLEVVEATVSFPFDLPDTPINRRIFKHVQIPASTELLTEEHPATVEADGALVRKGIFVLDRYRGAFEGYFKADAGVFSSMKDQLIGEFVDDVIELEGSVEFLAITEDTDFYEEYEKRGD